MPLQESDAYNILYDTYMVGEVKVKSSGRVSMASQCYVASNLTGAITQDRHLNGAARRGCDGGLSDT